MRRSPGIVLRIWEIGETDLLASVFTKDQGAIRGVAKGGRKSARRFVNCLDTFCLIHLEYEPRKKGDLYFLHSCKLVHAFPGIRDDFSSLALASYMAEITEILFPLGVSAQRMYALLKDSLEALEQEDRRDLIRMYFEARAMTLGGYGISLDRCVGCGRPYRGEGKAVFVPKQGGIACLGCQEPSKLSPALGPDAVTGLRCAQEAKRAELEQLSLDDEFIQEVQSVLHLHLTYRLEQPLKTARYLDKPA